ncbi:MAG: APC family permease [Chitinophagales bacterium]
MKKQKKLSELEATAICGNDISSSCLYVSALSIVYAGQWAWLALLIVAVVLFFFRKIYGEAVGALPLNGGTYNVLLNTTSKSNASFAACLTVLSYMATAVISASVAISYLQSLVPAVPLIVGTVILLTLFLIITILGISESARVAVVIFIIHLTTLSLLLVFSGIYLFQNGFQTLLNNFSLPLNGSFSSALFFGFSAAMLGISGFESSANFVEEQKPGVFRKTLRNMWVVVSIFNPLLTIFAIAIIPLYMVKDHESTLLSHLGNIERGSWLSILISIDAVLVLSGAVLTSFVGVSGLIKRMTLDRVFPQLLLKENRFKSSYRVLIIFFLLCFSVLMITRGELEQLAGVYTISFLSVMALFAIGNLLLKAKRSRLPRPEYASGASVFLGLSGVVVALYGNIRLHPEYLVVFLQYFIPSLLIVYAMLNRIIILNLFLMLLKSITENFRKIALFSHLKITKIVKRIHEQEFVFFTRGDNVAVLNKVMMYVEENEYTRKLKIVAILKEGHKIDERFLRDLEVLDRLYPDVNIEFITRIGQFGPDLIDHLSHEWKIPKNFMFIGSPGDKFPYRISDLGGVRLII